MNKWHVNVSSVAEYFNLPKTQRECYGLYLLPIALPSELFGEEEGWDTFYNRIRSEYPIQWIFRYWLMSYDNPLYAFFVHLKFKTADIKYGFQNFLKPCVPRWRKTLPRHKYNDVSYLIVESNFNLLLDFYYEEATKDIVDWEACEVHKQFYSQLCDYALWITRGRAILEAKRDLALTRATENKAIRDYHVRYKDYHDLQKQLFDKETEILHWIADKREMFWT